MLVLNQHVIGFNDARIAIYIVSDVLITSIGCHVFLFMLPNMDSLAETVPQTSFHVGCWLVLLIPHLRQLSRIQSYCKGDVLGCKALLQFELENPSGVYKKNEWILMDVDNVVRQLNSSYLDEVVDAVGVDWSGLQDRGNHYQIGTVNESRGIAYFPDVSIFLEVC